jgi:hypothetical protein
LITTTAGICEKEWLDIIWCFARKIDDREVERTPSAAFKYLE